MRRSSNSELNFDCALSVRMCPTRFICSILLFWSLSLCNGSGFRWTCNSMPFCSALYPLQRRGACVTAVPLHPAIACEQEADILWPLPLGADTDPLTWIIIFRANSSNTTWWRRVCVSLQGPPRAFWEQRTDFFSHANQAANLPKSVITLSILTESAQWAADTSKECNLNFNDPIPLKESSAYQILISCFILGPLSLFLKT